MVDGSSSPSFFNNKWRHHDITSIVKGYILYVSQLNNSIRHLTVEVFEYWFICTGTCSRVSCTLKDNNKIVRCTKLHYSKVLPSTFKISSTETSFSNKRNYRGKAKASAKHTWSARHAWWRKARLQPSCASLAPRPLSALWRTLKIALVLQATKNFHNNWRSGLLRRRELQKKITNKQMASMQEQY